MLNFKIHRPDEYSDKEVQSLSQIGKALLSLLINTQESFHYNTLILSKEKLEELTQVIVEFAEDLINEIGIWQSLEEYNKKYFGNPLPFSLQADERMPEKIINKKRLHYFLWNKYSELNPTLILSPTHKDLNFIVENVFTFFEDHKNEISLNTSSIESFLNQSNQYGWQVKRKLLWLGEHSYLFRFCYENYINDNGGKPEISLIDDFVCQHTTQWSGLGVIDILASLLNISKRPKSLTPGNTFKTLLPIRSSLLILSAFSAALLKSLKMKSFPLSAAS